MAYGKHHINEGHKSLKHSLTIPRMSKFINVNPKPYYNINVWYNVQVRCAERTSVINKMRW